MDNWGEEIRRHVVEAINQVMEGANRHARGVLTASASLWVAYMGVAWVAELAHTAYMVYRRNRLGPLGEDPFNLQRVLDHEDFVYFDDDIGVDEDE